MDDLNPFRGSRARRELAWTRAALRGPNVRKLFHDVYIAAIVDVDLRVRARAALLVHPTGVVGGVAAGAVWGSPYGSVQAEVDLYVTTSGARSQPGLAARRDALRHDEITTVDGIRVTTARRTAFDLARHLPLVEAVAAVDALCHVTSTRPEDILEVARWHPGVRGLRAARRVVEFTDFRATSPAWSRARLALAMRGLPTPVVSHWYCDDGGAPLARLELAWPEQRYGVQAVQHGPRIAHGASTGWLVVQVDPAAAVERADEFAAGVARGLRHAERRRRARVV